MINDFLKNINSGICIMNYDDDIELLTYGDFTYGRKYQYVEISNITNSLHNNKVYFVKNDYHKYFLIYENDFKNSFVIINTEDQEKINDFIETNEYR